MDEVNRSSMSPEQKATATRQILMQAIATGGLIVLGIGISTKLSRVAEASNFKEIESNWLNKQIKVGDPLPEGYNWKNKQISRNPNKAVENYVPLTTENGRIVVRENIERLSNPNVMRNNFKAEVENRLKTRGLTGEALRRGVEMEMSRVQIHHIIPDELVRNTELGKAAQKAGYNLDEAGNLKGMPRKSGDKLGIEDIEHRGSHPQYTQRVQDRMEQIERQLIKKYKSLDNVPNEIIRKKMKDLEIEFRNSIETNQVPNRDGKLAFLPSQRMLHGGKYEIRV